MITVFSWTLQHPDPKVWAQIILADMTVVIVKHGGPDVRVVLSWLCETADAARVRALQHTTEFEDRHYRLDFGVLALSADVDTTTLHHESRHSTRDLLAPTLSNLVEALLLEGRVLA